MKYERIMWILAVLMIGGAGFYTGQQRGFATGQAAVQQTTTDFFAQRGGPRQADSNGFASGTGGGPQRTGQGGAGQGVNGEVVSINGATMTVKNQRDGTTLTVQIDPKTQIHKQADGQVSDIKVGDTIVALGARSGDTITAESIQIGGLGGFRQGGVGPTTTPGSTP